MVTLVFDEQENNLPELNYTENIKKIWNIHHNPNVKTEKIIQTLIYNTY